MTEKIIKNGTVVTADLTYKADIRLANGVITEIGPNLTGGEVLLRAVLETAEIVG